MLKTERVLLSNVIVRKEVRYGYHNHFSGACGTGG